MQGGLPSQQQQPGELVKHPQAVELGAGNRLHVIGPNQVFDRPSFRDLDAS